MKSIAVLLTLALSIPAQAALAVVDASCGQAANTHISATAINAATGNALWVFVGHTGSGCTESVVAVTDTAGNTFTAVGAANPEFFVCSGGVYYAKNITGNASNVVTVEWDASVSDGGIVVVQVSGANTTAPLDAGPASAHDETSPASSASYSTNTADQIIIAGIINYYVVSVITPEAGYTIPSGASCNARSFGQITAQYKIVSSTQSSITTSFTLDTNTYAQIDLATFKAATVASPSSVHGGTAVHGGGVVLQ